MNIANVVCRGYGPSASIAFIVTRGFGVGAPSTVTVDRHDAVWDERAFRKYQKQLKKQAREAELRLEEANVNRAKLRKTLENALNRIEEPQVIVAGIIEAKNDKITIPESTPDYDLGLMAERLQALDMGLKRFEQELIKKAIADWKQQDEDEVEMILSEILW